MGIQLKRLLQNSNFSPEEQREILKQDHNRDGKLDESDLAARFGKSAARRFMADLDSSLRQKRFSSFVGSLGKLEEARRLLFSQAFTGPLLEKKAELQGLGVSFDGNRMNFSGLSPESAGKARDILSAVLQTVYSPEFQALSPAQQRDFSYRLGEWIRHIGTPQGAAPPNRSFSIGDIAEQILQKDALQWNHEAFSEEAQAEYADIQYHEIHPTAALAKLEKKYGIDIRISGGELKPAEIAVLEKVLSRVQALRPQDLRSIPFITLYLSEERGGGVTQIDQGGDIKLFGPFGQPLADAKLSLGYALDLKESFSKDGETFLLQALLHEMGHRQENAEVLRFYQGLFPDRDHRVLEELMAEDYRSFLFSGGQSVSSAFADGREIGKQAERLAWVRSKYPLK